MSSLSDNDTSIDQQTDASRGYQWMGAALALLVVFFIWLAFQAGIRAGNLQSNAAEVTAIVKNLAQERAAIATIQRDIIDNLDTLALHVGSVRAHSLRLDALGERLVGVGELDPQEFDFSEEPALGGFDSSEGQSPTAMDIATELEALTGLLNDREEKLDLLEEFIMNRQLQHEIMPSGRPVTKGWLSSGFGHRTDPFTGKKKYHRGLDFSGKVGSDVIAVAAGVVTRAGKEGGYGNLVEIRHADGYFTRYAHNKENLVQKGDMVEKGQTIALLGATGRASGPHVHFEVRKDGRIINPRKFVNDKK